MELKEVMTQMELLEEDLAYVISRDGPESPSAKRSLERLVTAKQAAKRKESRMERLSVAMMPSTPLPSPKSSTSSPSTLPATSSTPPFDAGS